MEMPDDTPVTTPDELTEEILMLPLLHTPPVAVSESEIVEPTQTKEDPDIAPANGNGFTVIVLVVIVVPHEFVTE